MTIHAHDSGYAELMDSWGHGTAQRGDWERRPVTIIADDGDGHYHAWAYTGRRVDAIARLAPLYRRSGTVVVVEEGYLRTVNPEPDFWVEDEYGDFAPNLAKYPEVVAY